MCQESLVFNEKYIIEIRNLKTTDSVSGNLKMFELQYDRLTFA